MLLVLGLLCCLPGVHTRASEWLNLGLAYDLFDHTLEPGQRMEAAGPFYYRDEGESTRIWAVPPVMSLMKQPATEMTEFSLAYPLFTYIRYGGQYRAQLFQLLSFAGGPSQTETNRSRFTVFPLYFQQWSSDPEQEYVAVGPFYGHLKNRLMRDEINYVMFPLYSRTRKRDVVTDNYLFPIFHLREGDGLIGWQFWPIVGHEKKEITTRTNGFGDVEVVPGHERSFVLWPFFHNQQALLPFYAFTRSPKRDATTVLWPFFSRIENHEREFKEWQVPWPFIIFADGPGKTTRRIFPFYSHSQSTNQHNDFYLWPLYRYNGLRTASLERERRRLLFFLFSDTQEKNLENQKTRRRTDLWPLFTRRREWNGNERLQILAPLEPILPGNHNIEIEYSHAWSLWRSEKNPRTGASCKSLLWNLYRNERRPDRRQTSFFFGLFQSKKDTLGTETRLFFLPIHRSDRGLSQETSDH
jgi:hypothetical protein